MKRSGAFLLVALAAIGLGSTSCRAPAGTMGDQTRFSEQQKHYPDRLSSEQEAEAAERARLNDRLKKP